MKDITAELNQTCRTDYKIFEKTEKLKMLLDCTSVMKEEYQHTCQVYPIIHDLPILEDTSALPPELVWKSSHSRQSLLLCNEGLGMKAPAAPALPSQNCWVRNLTLYFSLNGDTWIYICDVILLFGLNAITDTNIIITTRKVLNLWTFLAGYPVWKPRRWI